MSACLWPIHTTFYNVKIFLPQKMHQAQPIYACLSKVVDIIRYDFKYINHLLKNVEISSDIDLDPPKKIIITCVSLLRIPLFLLFREQNECMISKRDM